MKFEKEIKFIPCSGSVDCKFFLKGEKGIIQFCISTGWNENSEYNNPSKTYSYDVGYHSPIPLYEDQKPMDKCCFYDKCYYDGSSMYARTVFDLLIKFGEEKVWQELESAYNRWLENKDT